VQVFIDRCRLRDQAAFVSVRMNDAHHKEYVDPKPGDKPGSSIGMSVTRWYAEHPEHRIKPGSERGADRVLNWAVPEVREQKFALIQELFHTLFKGAKVQVGYDVFPYRRATREHLHTSAHLAYARGADGISLFNFAYCQVAVCNPSRVSILSGARADTTGVLDNQHFMRQMMPDVIALPQHFKNHGWQILSLGKIYHHSLREPGEDPLFWTSANTAYSPR